MKKVILDTNFLLLPIEFNLDIFEVIPEVLEDKVEFFIVDKSLNELTNLAKGRGKAGMAARVAMSLLQKKDVKVVKTKDDESCDDAIVRVAVTLGAIVATNDKNLRKKLKDFNVKTIYLRSKKHLELG